MMTLKKLLSVAALSLVAVGCGGQELEPLAEGAGAAEPVAERQDAVTSNYSINHWCTSTPQGSQVCSPRWTICKESASGSVAATFVASSQHCSNISMRFYVNGVLKNTSAVLAPGQSSGRLSLGTVSAGCQEIALEAVGYTGGCNTGTMTGWSGSLTLETP